jgi:hypothetical protein
MKRRLRSRKQRRGNARVPATPGPTKCSPISATRRGDSQSCLPVEALRKISSSTRKRGGSQLALNSTNVNVNELAKELGCDSNDGRCIVQKSLLSHKEKKALLDTFFRPAMPEEWKKDPDVWLTSDDIAAVMKQYEKAYPQFKFLGVVPIDFSAPDPYQSGGSQEPSKLFPEKKCMNDQFCHVDLAAEKAAGRKILGAVFNLDPHYKGGSHWVALAVDLMRDCAYYFDSYGMAPPDQVARFMRYLTLQNPKLKLQSNGRRFQYSDTECGMYSMYFLIRMIAGESFKKFCKNPIGDKYMLAFRKVLFDQNASKQGPVQA